MIEKINVLYLVAVISLSVSLVYSVAVGNTETTTTIGSGLIGFLGGQAVSK